MSASNGPETFEHRLQALHRAYVDGLPDKLQAILTAWETACSGHSPQLEEPLRLVHSMAGSGATFGHQAVGTAARAIELKLKSLVTGGQTPSEGDKAEMRSLLASLQSAIATAVNGADNIDEGAEPDVVGPDVETTQGWPQPPHRRRN